MTDSSGAGPYPDITEAPYLAAACLHILYSILTPDISRIRRLGNNLLGMDDSGILVNHLTIDGDILTDGYAWKNNTVLDYGALLDDTATSDY